MMGKMEKMEKMVEREREADEDGLEVKVVRYLYQSEE